MTPDPGHIGANIGDPQSWNAYAYGFNDPITFTDPMGLCPPTDNNWQDCPTSVGITVSAPRPGAEILSGLILPNGGCMEIVYDGIPLGNTCDSLGGPSMQAPPKKAPTSRVDVKKSYPLFIPCAYDAGQVMAAVQANFPKFGNYSAGPFSVTFSPPPLEVGAKIPITVGYFGVHQKMGVSVRSMLLRRRLSQS